MADNGWGDLAAAALMWYMNKQGNKAPNFYNVPQSPEQKWQFGQTQDLTNFAKNYAQQFIGGQNLNPGGFKFTSNALKDQPFAGGIQLPKFDFSKLAFGTPAGTAGGGFTTGSIPGLNPDGTPNLSGRGPSGGNTNVGVGNGRNAPDQQIAVGDGGIGDMYGKSIYQIITENPGVDLGTLFGGAGGMGSSTYDPNADPDFFGKVGKAWDQYKRDHPDWLRSLTLGSLSAWATATFGPLGGAAVKLIGKMIGGGSGTPTQTPTTSRQFPDTNPADEPTVP